MMAAAENNNGSFSIRVNSASSHPVILASVDLAIYFADDHAKHLISNLKGSI